MVDAQEQALAYAYSRETAERPTADQPEVPPAILHPSPYVNRQRLPPPDLHAVLVEWAHYPWRRPEREPASMRGLDRKIDIERKTVTQDEFGEEVELWDKLAFRLSASVSPVRGEERFTSEQSVARQVEFRVRYSAEVADLSLLDRIVYPPFSSDASPVPTPPDEQVYDIIEVHELGRKGRKEGLRIVAGRRALRAL